MTTTWNPSDNSNGTLSNGNLTVSFQTTASTWKSIRSTTTKTTGKFVFVCTLSAIDPVSGNIIGLADATASLTNYAGSSSDSAGFLTLAGNAECATFPGPVVYNTGGFATPAIGDNIAIAVDVDNSLWWANDLTQASGWTDGAGGHTGNPAAGTGGKALGFAATGGTLIMGSGEFNGGADTLILNPTCTGFTSSIPSGFSAWDSAAAVNGTLGQTIDPLMSSAAGAVIAAGTCAAAVDDLTSAAAGTVTVSGSLAATIDAITAQAAGTSGAVVPAPHDSPAVPWWWAAYVRRHEAEREAARLKWLADNTAGGDGWATLPAPVGHGQGIHDPDEADVPALAAVALLLAA